MKKKEIGLNIILLFTLICSLFLSTQFIQVSASVGAEISLTPPSNHSDVYVAENSGGYIYTGPTYAGWVSNYQRWTCLYWDLSSISGTISTADVRIYCQVVAGGSLQVNLYRITSDWLPYTGGTPVWATKPSYDTNTLETFTAVSPVANGLPADSRVFNPASLYH